MKHDPMREIRWGLSALLLIFIALKLMGEIEWSWLWVLSPFWIPCAIAVVGYSMYFIGLRMMSPEARRAYKAKEAVDRRLASLYRNKPR